MLVYVWSRIEMEENEYIKLAEKAELEIKKGSIETAKKILSDSSSLAKKENNTPYMNFFLGKYNILNNEFDYGVSLIRESIKALPKNIFLIENLANIYIDKKKYQEAVNLFEDILNINPKNNKILRRKGVLLSQLGKDLEAIRSYEKALEEDPDDSDSLRNIGISLSRLKRNREAIKWYNRALDKKPNDYYSLIQKGLSLHELGCDTEAITYYDEAAEEREELGIDNIYLDLLKKKGVALSNLGEQEEAISCFEKILEKYPNDSDSLRQKGIALSKQGNFQEAINCYDKVLTIEPEDWHTLISKALSLERINRKEEALQMLTYLYNNRSKIKDKEITDMIIFKKNFFEKEINKESNILNEIINSFPDNGISFLAEIKRNELGFKDFLSAERSIPKDFFPFLVILRKWNSYTPILYSVDNCSSKGGGYFLYLNGKGIVVDPGFNFIENFFSEGFTVADIDAVLISHAHNDHTVDLESILTLVHKYNEILKDLMYDEWKEYILTELDEVKIQNKIKNEMEKCGKKIDLFINLGTFEKYSGWINLNNSQDINNITVLMPEMTYSLFTDKGDIQIHTTRAKHNEVIDDKYAIGFILDVGDIKVGFTGDTGWDWDHKGAMAKPFEDYSPGLIVAHLGSIKSKEFNYVNQEYDDDMRNKCFYDNHLGLLGITKFLDKTKPDLTIISEFGEELASKRRLIAETISRVIGKNCLPGDIGLYIRLDNLNIFCIAKGEFVDNKSIKVSESSDHLNLYYSTLDPDSILLKSRKETYVCKGIPISKRMNNN